MNNIILKILRKKIEV